jgi:hypothetical protein
MSLTSGLMVQNCLERLNQECEPYDRQAYSTHIQIKNINKILAWKPRGGHGIDGRIILILWLKEIGYVGVWCIPDLSSLGHGSWIRQWSFGFHENVIHYTIAPCYEM